MATLEQYTEEGLLRLRAADAYAQLTGDRAGRAELIAAIVKWMREGLSQPIDLIARDFPLKPEQIALPPA